MEQKSSKNDKINSSNISLNIKNNFQHQASSKLLEDESRNNKNQIKLKNLNKNNNKNMSVKETQINSPIKMKIKIEKINIDKNNFIYSKTIDNSNNKNNYENSKKKIKQKYAQSNVCNIKSKNKKLIRTFSGCGHKRKCSLNNKGTFNSNESKIKKIVVRNTSKDKEKYYYSNSLLSNDFDAIQEYNSTNSNINNKSIKKNNKLNIILTMTNYLEKEKNKFINKINQEDIKSDKKNNKNIILKPRHILKYKEEISIIDKKNEKTNNIIQKIKNKNSTSKKLYEKNKKNQNKDEDKLLINTNNIYSTIEETNKKESKIRKIHVIERIKNKNKKENLLIFENKDIEGDRDDKKNINNSVDNKNNKNQIVNNSNKSNEIMNNYFSFNLENSKKAINSCLKKSIKKDKNIYNKEKENSNKKKINNIKKLNYSKTNNYINKEIKNNKNNINSIKKINVNIKAISSNQNLKNDDNYNKYIKINKFNNYVNTLINNRLQLALNVVNCKNNYNNLKYSLIRNIKNQLNEEKNFNNLLFILNILSNWGNKKQIGITGIEIFDINNQKIKIKECKVEGGNNEHIERLFNEKIYTINENDMWITDIDNYNSKNINFLNIKIYFYISKYINLESINNINIWNYNGYELNKGIKKIELLANDEDIIYCGIVPKGEYNTKCFHPYKIRINQKLLLKRNKNKIYKITHFLYNTYKYDNDPSYDFNYLSCNNSIINKNSEIKNAYYSIMKHSSLNNTRKINKFNFFKIKSSRSCYKNKNNYSSFVNNDYKKNKNYSENKNKNKNYISNKIKSIKKLSNNSFIFEKNKKNKIKSRDSYDIKNINNEKNKIYSLSTIKLDKNNSINNIKLLDSIKKNNNDIKHNSFNISTKNNTIINSKKKDNSNNKRYIIFKKIRINILTNYGNTHLVGLTGINFIDKDNNKIDIESAETVGALPKDLRTLYYNENEYRIFENVFNGINNTINENLMWLTLINPNPFIEICFKNEMSLSRIEIWNFNEPLGLDKGAKDIEIIFDDNGNKKYNIILWKGLGIDYYNYFQNINFDGSEDISNIYFKLNNILKNNTKYPTGFVFKLIFISNFGDKDMISLKKFELYNERNILLSNYKIIHDNYNNDVNHLNNNSLKNIIKTNNINYFYYHKFLDFRKDEDSICNNLLFICFKEIVQIKYIKIQNISNIKLKNTAVKNLQIYCDDLLIFEGELKQKGENIILFEKKEIKKFNNVINLSEKKDKNKYLEKRKGDVFRLVNVGSYYE